MKNAIYFTEPICVKKDSDLIRTYYIDKNEKSITDYLGVSRETVLQWINNRNIPAHKVGRLRKFKISEVDGWIRSGGAADKSKPDNVE